MYDLTSRRVRDAEGHILVDICELVIINYFGLTGPGRVEIDQKTLKVDYKRKMKT